MGTALITGASSGLGLEFAHLFVKDAHSVVLVARRRDLLNKLSEDLKKINPKVRVDIIDMDLSVVGAGVSLFNKVTALNVKIEFLVNNAGFGTHGAFKDLPLNVELQMMDLNMRTLVELTHLFLPGMLQRGMGRILNVGSTAGFQAGPFMATYFATKAFVNSWSEALNFELKGTGVSCTGLAPGNTATGFASAAHVEKLRLVKQNSANARDVAEIGYRAMFKGKSLVVANLANKIMVQLLRLSPRAFTIRVVAFLTSK